MGEAMGEAEEKEGRHVVGGVACGHPAGVSSSSSLPAAYIGLGGGGGVRVERGVSRVMGSACPAVE